MKYAEKIRTAVLAFLVHENPARPFGQEHSYYHRSSSARDLAHGFEDMLWTNKRGLGAFFEKTATGSLVGTNDMFFGKVLRGYPKDSIPYLLACDLEKYFLVGFLASAIYDAQENQQTPDTVRWHHEPFYGAFVTLDDIFGTDNWSAHQFDSLWHKDDTEIGIELMMARGKFDFIWSINRADGPWTDELPGLHQQLMAALGAIKTRILEHLQTLETVP